MAQELTLTAQKGGINGRRGFPATTDEKAEAAAIAVIANEGQAGVSTENVVRLGIAHVPQGRGTFTNMTVEENLQLGAISRSESSSMLTSLGQTTMTVGSGAARAALEDVEGHAWYLCGPDAAHVRQLIELQRC